LFEDWSLTATRVEIAFDPAISGTFSNLMFCEEIAHPKVLVEAVGFSG
jgi:hypothetical protein